MVAAAGSIATAAVGREGGNSDEAASDEPPAGYCIKLLREARDWASDNPEDAAKYAAPGDNNDSGLPDLWTDEEQRRCDGDVEELLESNPPSAPEATENSGDDSEGSGGEANGGGSSGSYQGPSGETPAPDAGNSVGSDSGR